MQRTAPRAAADADRQPDVHETGEMMPRRINRPGAKWDSARPEGAGSPRDVRQSNAPS